MGNTLTCPLCQRLVFSIEKWRGIYLCVPCFSKFEKIEKAIATGQELNSRDISNILSTFGDEEIKNIKGNPKFTIDGIKTRKKRAAKNSEAMSIKPNPRKKKI